jgi:P27 family predicted phage terminase small subunit
MTRGRKPKPTALHELHGTRNATRHKGRTAEPEAPGALERSPPEHLTERQKEGWRFAMDHAPVAVLRRIDRGILTAWVILEDMLRTANTELERSDQGMPHPLLARGKGGVQVNPYVLIIERCARGMSKLASELGFSPASRPRITGGTAIPDQPQQTAAQSPFARIKGVHERRRATTAGHTLQ